MIIIAVVVVVVVILLAVLAYYFTRTKDEPKETPSPKGNELVITEDGASMSEGYRIMPRRENYIQVPEVEKCGTDRAPEYCSVYDASDTNGFAYVYDLSLSDIRNAAYNECQGGGHECWFIEKYDDDGTLISVVNKNGDNMLDMIADDIWADKWSTDSPIVNEISTMVEFKDGTLKAKKKLNFGGGKKVEMGEAVKLSDMPTSSLYFIALFGAMKNADVEKPSKITLNVKNSRDKFKERVDNHKNKSAAPPSDA